MPAERSEGAAAGRADVSVGLAQRVLVHRDAGISFKDSIANSDNNHP